MSGTFIYRHHVEPRVKLYSPREESFPIPLKYIDVTRTTHTNLDVKQEKRIDDYWNIDGSRDLSDPWTGFTQIILLEEKPPDGKMWSGGRLTRKQLTSRPHHLWPELWKSMGKHAKLKEKQKWSNEKPQRDNALKLRGICFIDPENKEFKETIKNARKKLETSVAPAMPCKILKICGSDVPKKINGIDSVNDFMLPILALRTFASSFLFPENFVLHGYDWIHRVAKSCITTAIAPQMPPLSLCTLLSQQSHLFLICVVYTHNDSRIIPRRDLPNSRGRVWCT